MKHKINWAGQWEDWKKHPIKETRLLLLWLYNKVRIRYTDFVFQNEVDAFTAAMRHAILNSKEVRHTMRMAGMNYKEPYVVEVNYKNKLVLVQQYSAELVYTYQAVEELSNVQ